MSVLPSMNPFLHTGQNWRVEDVLGVRVGVNANALI